MQSVQIVRTAVCTTHKVPNSVLRISPSFFDRKPKIRLDPTRISLIPTLPLPFPIGTLLILYIFTTRLSIFFCRSSERCRLSMMGPFVLRPRLVSWQFNLMGKWKIPQSLYSKTKGCQARSMHRLPGLRCYFVKHCIHYNAYIRTPPFNVAEINYVICQCSVHVAYTYTYRENQG